jgi:hypothetical protein
MTGFNVMHALPDTSQQHCCNAMHAMPGRSEQHVCNAMHAMPGTSQQHVCNVVHPMPGRSQQRVSNAMQAMQAMLGLCQVASLQCYAMLCQNVCKGLHHLSIKLARNMLAAPGL